MSLFSSGKRDVRFGTLIEIGSGSVTVSIIKSDSSKQNPEIIWSRKEFASLKTAESQEQDYKNIMSVLMNVILLVNSTGHKALKTFDSKAQLGYVQISITAPWSCTISKTIEYSEDNEFVITSQLINKLVTAAQKKVDEKRVEQETTSKHDLTVLTKNIADIKLNGYKTTRPLGQRVKDVSITQVSAIADASITRAVIDLQRKVLPHADLKMYSFMMIFQSSVQGLYPQICDFCLIDMTYEATELAIIRNGSLQYSTHTHIGINTLARGIAKVLKIPHEEALVFIRESNYSEISKTLSDSKIEAVNEVLQDYQSQLVNLFKETGDNLSIPRAIFLHGSATADTILQTQIIYAAQTTTGSSHAICEISNEILLKSYNVKQKKALFSVTSDIGILLAAQFFHTKKDLVNFIHE